jgi:hypothetical protein
MKKQFSYGFFLFLLLTASCVGTDFIEDPIIAEKIRISPRLDSLALGKEQIFTAQYFNQFGQAETPKAIIWRSNAPDRISIDATGKAKVLVMGAATIYATYGKATDSLVLNNKTQTGGNNDTSFIRRGVFQSASSSYQTRGNIRVQTVRGVSQIVTDANFSVSAGPSLYLLLANHTTGSYTITPGSNARNAVSVQITANKLSQFSGAQTWSLPAGVNPADYRYAVLYCALGPVFGFADLK